MIIERHSRSHSACSKVSPPMSSRAVRSRKNHPPPMDINSPHGRSRLIGSSVSGPEQVLFAGRHDRDQGVTSAQSARARPGQLASGGELIQLVGLKPATRAGSRSFSHTGRRDITGQPIDCTDDGRRSAAGEARRCQRGRNPHRR